jgi:hypothetical protein
LGISNGELPKGELCCGAGLAGAEKGLFGAAGLGAPKGEVFAPKGDAASWGCPPAAAKGLADALADPAIMNGDAVKSDDGSAGGGLFGAAAVNGLLPNGLPLNASLMGGNPPAFGGPPFRPSR